MALHSGRRSPRRLAAASLALALLGSLVPLVGVSANPVTVTGATGGSQISADTNSAGGSGAYTLLTGPVLQETAAGDMPTGGNVILTVPTGFQYKPSPNSVTATVGGVGCAGLTVGAVTTTTTALTIPITGTSTAPCSITVSGLEVRPTAGSPLQSGAILNTGNRGNLLANYGTLTEVEGAAILTFTSPPIASTTGGATLAPNPTFHDQDAWGNVRNGDGPTLSIAPGTGTPGAVLTCAVNPKPTAGLGDVTFTGCSIDKAGIGYKLRASLGSVFVDTNAFNISVGPPTKLIFTSYPAASTPSVLTPQPAVAVADAGGNVITTDNSTSILLAISSNAGTFSCTGGLTKTVTAGIAQYAGCTQTSTGNYQLSASSTPFYTPVTGPVFNVSSASASKLAFCWSPALACPTTPPTPNGAGVAFSSQPTIRVQDAAGNTVISDNTTVVTLALAPGTPTAGGPGTLTCTGGNSKTVTAGVATFTGCSIDKVGTNYQIIATSSPALTSATSLALSVVAGPASKLTFTSQPPATVAAGAAFPTNVTVAITDAGGNVISSGITATITLAIGNNPASGTLTCTGGLSATTVNGVATFTGCSISAAGTGYTLTATASNIVPPTALTPATSAAFNVTANAAVITISSVPSNGVILWGQDVVLNVHVGGAGGNRTVSIQVTKDQVTWSTIAGAAALVTNASGDVSFVYGPSDNRYYRAVFAGAPDLGAGTSNIQRVVVRTLNLLRPTNNGAIRTISRGTTIVFTSTIRPNRPELPQNIANFVVYQKIGSSYVKIIDVNIPVNRSTGKATFSRTFSTAGQFYVRSQAIPSPFNANSGWSQLEFYRVR